MTESYSSLLSHEITLISLHSEALYVAFKFDQKPTNNVWLTVLLNALN